MKKKITCIILFICIICGLGGIFYYQANHESITTLIPKHNDKSLTYSSIVLKSKGDKVYQISQITKTNLAHYNEDELQTWINELTDNYNQYKGINYAAKKTKKKLIETITVDVNKANAEAFEILGIDISLPKNKDSSKIKVTVSLKETVKSLKKEGYKINK